MMGKTLSQQEKMAIDAILSQAELEFFPTNATPIETMDAQCRNIWPDWDPQLIAKNRVSRSNKLNDSEINNLVEKSNFQSEPLPEKPISIQYDDRSTTQETESNRTDIQSLREEAENLMCRINQTVELNKSPQTEKQLIRHQKPKNIKNKVGNQTNIDEHVENKKEKIQKQTKSQKISSAPKASNPKTDKTIPTPNSQYTHPKTKAQAKQIISSTSKQITQIENENQTLRQRLAEMQKAYNEAQKEIQSLKQQLRKSEDIRAKLPKNPKSTVNQTRIRKKIEFGNYFS